MKTKSLILSALMLVLFVAQALSQQTSPESSIPERVIDEYRQDFWMTTETTEIGKYLIKVRLPGSYFKSDTSKYPVFYLTDADKYFGTASDCAHWVGRTGDEIILVGVSYGSREACNKNRGNDFDFGRDGKKFLAFIHEELVPTIESKFRADSSNKTLFGWSAGFWFVSNTISENAELFDNYLMGGISPAKAWIDGLYI